jgi:peptidoglycan-N-acetylglucosamine deacetylase
MRPRWLPPSALLWSIVWHLVALASVIWRPSLWPWALGAVVFDHLLLMVAGLLPRSRLLGANWTRLPANASQRNAVAITIDDGPDHEVTPRVLDILDRFKARATFFCIGDLVERRPDMIREILRRGHEVENHSQHHRLYFSLMGPKRMRAEICAAQTAIERIGGRRPLFFRAPAGLRNVFLDGVLRANGLRLASWTRRGFDTVNKDPDAIHRTLIRNLRAGDILLLHDGHAARTAAGVPIILDVLPRLLRTLEERSLATISLRAALT